MTDPIAQPEPNAPELTVIVTVVDGGAALARCLGALAAQENPPAMEVLVPYDSTIADSAALGAQFPHYRFVDMGAIADRPPENAFEEHELFDRRRTAGLRLARAPIVSMIEDRGWPRPGWARAMVDAHAAHPDGVIGGAVESAAKGMRRWAIFFVDFGRYQAPFDSENPEYVTDTNISYKRDAIMSVRDLWAYKYQESVINWALAENGVSLRLDAGPVTVQQREPLGLGEMAMERVHWGRVFGEVRARGKSFSERIKWIAVTPLLPAVLYVRHLRRQMRLGRHVGEYVYATPAILYLLVFWSIGELMGYFEASADGKPA